MSENDEIRKNFVQKSAIQTEFFFLTTITKTLISPSNIGIKSSFWTFFDSKFPDLEAGIDIDWCLTFSTEINASKFDKNVKI